jgi:hypothetical protein
LEAEGAYLIVDPVPYQTQLLGVQGDFQPPKERQEAVCRICQAALLDILLELGF